MAACWKNSNRIMADCLPPGAQTGSMGWHCFFRSPMASCYRRREVQSASRSERPDFAGVDILTAGSYVVAPPALHVSGRRYCWSVDHHPGDVAARRGTGLDRRAVHQGGAERRAATALDPAEWAELTVGLITEYQDVHAAQRCRQAGALRLDRPALSPPACLPPGMSPTAARYSRPRGTADLLPHRQHEASAFARRLHRETRMNRN